MTTRPRGPSNGTRRARYDALYDEIAGVLERHDPMGVVADEIDAEFGPLDEYDPEATAIVARLGTAATTRDVREIIREVFVEWFGEEPPGLDAVAAEIWALVEPSPSAS